MNGGNLRRSDRVYTKATERERGKDDAFSEHKLAEDLFIRKYLFSYKAFSTFEEEMLD